MMQALAGPDYPASVLARLLDGLPPARAESLARTALPKALAIKDHYERARELADLAPYLPPDERDTALRAGLAAAGRVRSAVLKVSAYSLLRPRLPADP